jgi:hypothetical protein
MDFFQESSQKLQMGGCDHGVRTLCFHRTLLVGCGILSVVRETPLKNER